MAIKLYNPKTQTFTSFTPPVSDLLLSELLLVNILIELQTLSNILSAGCGDDAADIRTDIASVT